MPIHPLSLPPCKLTIKRSHRSTVPLVWREVYGTAVLMLVASRLLLVRTAADGDATPSSALVSCMKLLDLGIMMGGPRTQPLLHSAVSETERIVALAGSHSSATAAGDERRPWKRQRNEPQGNEHMSTARSAQLPLPPPMDRAVCMAVPRRSLPPLEVFLQQHMKRRHPVVLTNAMRDWPAMTPISTSGSELVGGLGEEHVSLSCHLSHSHSVTRLMSLQIREATTSHCGSVDGLTCGT